MISTEHTWSAYNRAATQLRLSAAMDPAPKCDQARAALAGMLFAVETFCAKESVPALLEEGLGIDEDMQADLRCLFRDLRDAEPTPRTVVIDLPTR
jgi:hypothetical protein